MASDDRDDPHSCTQRHDSGEAFVQFFHTVTKALERCPYSDTRLHHKVHNSLKKEDANDENAKTKTQQDPASKSVKSLNEKAISPEKPRRRQSLRASHKLNGYASQLEAAHEVLRFHPEGSHPPVPQNGFQIPLEEQTISKPGRTWALEALQRTFGQGKMPQSRCRPGTPSSDHSVSGKGTVSQADRV